MKPILDALKAKGVTVRKDDPRKGDALVLFLSEAVKADSPVVDQFFRLNAGRELVIPVNLDGSTPPEELQNALMARHAIFAQRYAPAELAELIRKALPEKRPLPLILALLGAAAFLAVGAILLFRQRQTPPPLRSRPGWTASMWISSRWPRWCSWGTSSTSIPLTSRTPRAIT